MSLGIVPRRMPQAPVLGACRRAPLLILSVLVLAACEHPVTSDAPAVGRIEVDPTQTSLAAGRTATFSAHVYGPSGTEITPAPVFWSSQNAQVATVNQAGVVTAIGAGSTQIAASLNGRSGVAALTVTPRPVVAVRVNPSESDVTIGKSLQLTTEALDAEGSPLAGRTTEWTTSNAAVATVSAGGLVSGGSAGSATIRAKIDGVEGTALVRVVAIAVARLTVAPNAASVPQGDFVQLTATPADAQGNTLSGRLVLWSSNNQSVAVVSNTGHVQTVSPGSATITAACEGITATATITVTQVPVASVTITPASPSLVVGGTATLSATVRDGQGNVLNGRTVTWTSASPSIASINSSGVLTGLTVGTTTITASSGGVNGTTTATISAVPVASVSVTPASAGINVGATVTLTATARDAQGNVLAGRTATWTTNNASVATVSPAGVVTGVAIGAATITVNISGITDAATITVTAVPVATVTVTPNPSSVEEHKTLTLTATARDANGAVLTGRTIVWSSSDNAVAAVTQSGVVTGIAPGSASITASAPNAGSGGSTPSGSTALTVTFAPVASVSVVPGSASVQVGGTTDFNATLRDAAGQTLSASGRTVTWSSTDPSRATVNASTGLATGLATGTTSIVATATSPGQSSPATGSGTLTVTSVPVASVVVTPNPATVHVGTAYARTFTAETRDAGGNLLTGRSVVWTSSNQSAATVDASTGLVTGIAAGTTTITATSDGVPGTASVTIDLVPVSSVTVTPPSASLTLPGTQQLAATPLDSAANTISGAALGGRTPSWSTSNSSVATVSTAGLVTAVAPGSATITADFGSASGTSAITVLGPVQNVAMTLGDTLFLPGTLPGSVLVTDAGGMPVAGQTVTFTSSSTSIGTVSPASATTDAAGQATFTFTGVAQGTTTVTATSGGTSASKTVRVLRPVAAITFSASSVTVTPSQPVTVTATARDANGTGLGSRFCTIVSNDTGVATVSPASATTSGNGRITITVTAQASGQTTVTVTCETVSASFGVTVP